MKKNKYEDIAIVTGASSGIGRAIAISLAEKGVKVALVARDCAKLEKVKKMITEKGGVAITISQDLMVQGAVLSVVEQVKEQLGTATIIVNAAGRVALGSIDKLSLKTWNSTLYLNLTVPYEFIHHLLPEMKKQKKGWIFNISSEVGSQVIQYSGIYGISKAALNKLSEIVDCDCRDFGIHVYSICPGWVETKLAINPQELGVERTEILQPEHIATLVSELYEKVVCRMSTIIEIGPLHSKASTRKSMKKYFEKCNQLE